MIINLFSPLSTIPFNHLKGFSFNVNVQLFKTTLFFLSCLSNKIYSTFIQNPSLSSLSIPIETESQQEVFNYVTNFVNYLTIDSFFSQSFSFSTFLKVVSKLQIDGYEKWFSQNHSLINSFEQQFFFFNLNMVINFNLI
jgi:hypothetical protein